MKYYVWYVYDIHDFVIEFSLLYSPCVTYIMNVYIEDQNLDHSSI